MIIEVKLTIQGNETTLKAIEDGVLLKSLNDDFLELDEEILNVEVLK